MAEFKNLKAGEVGLISQDENGNIFQIGLTESQSLIIHQVLSSMSTEQKLIRLPKEYDLKLKNQ